MSLVYFTVPVVCSTSKSPPFLKRPTLTFESYEGKQERAEANRHRLLQQRLSQLRQRLEKIDRLRERANDSEEKKLELDRALEQALEKRNQMWEEGIRARSERTHQVQAKKTWLDRLSSQQSEEKKQMLAEQLYQAEMKRMAKLQRFKPAQELTSRKKQQEMILFERCQRKRTDLEQQLQRAELKRQDWLNRRKPATLSSFTKTNNQSVKEKKEQLLKQLGRAEQKRELLLHQQVVQYAQQVARAKQIAAAQKQRHEEQKRNMFLALQQRLERSETQRQRQRSLASKKHKNVNTVTAAVKIQRWWRYLKCYLVVRLFKKRGLSPSHMKKLDFDQMTTRIQNPQAIRITDCLLGAIERLSGCTTSETKNGKRARIFLTAALMSLHSEEIMGPGELGLTEQSVLQAAKDLQASLRSWLVLFNPAKNCNGYPHFPSLWKDQTRLMMLHQGFHRYLGSFSAWKEKDNSAMVEHMKTHFNTLGTLWLRVREAEDAESWREKIYEQRVVLADQIKQLGGPELNPTMPLSEWQNELNLVMTEGEGVISNEKLLHEIVLDPQFRLSPPLSSTITTLNEENGLFKGIEEEKDLEFWVPLLIAQLKQRVLGILPERYLKQIDDLLDVELIGQQLDKRVFNLTELIRELLKLFQSTCAPCRDAQVTGFKEQLEELPIKEMLPNLFNLVDAMRLDMANFRISQLRPMLQRHGVAYERANFARKLAMGKVTLERTRRWLMLGETYQHAFLELLFNPSLLDQMELPETFMLDQARLERFSGTIHKLCVVAAILLITSAGGGTKMTADQLWMVNDLGSLFDEHQGEAVGGGVLSQAVKGEGPVYELLKKRLRVSIQQALVTGKEEIPVGLERVSDQLRRFQREVISLSRWNYQVYQEWYVNRD